MKKTMLMAVVLGAMGFAGAACAAEDASATLTWSGAVPMAPVSNGVIIKDAVGNDIERGALIFSVDAAGKGILTSSSTIDFNVYDYTGDVVGEPVQSYSYTMTSLQATMGGMPQEQDDAGYYGIMADGADLVKKTAVSGKSGVTNLTVVPTTTATPSNQPNAGEAVDVHARIVISNAAI